MRKNDLRQLQRLGIDIWVSRERAQELIARGQANSLLQVNDRVSSRATVFRSKSARNRGWDLPKDSPKEATERVTETRTRWRTTDPSTGTLRPQLVEKTPQQQFAAHLRVYLYGSAALTIEFSTSCSDPLVRDILKALSRFEEHHLNELHFKFPLIGRTKSNPTIATLAGAQEGFRAWFEQRAPHCESLLLIGATASDTAAGLTDIISRTIHIDTLPSARAGKQQLWNQIKNLNI